MKYLFFIGLLLHAWVGVAHAQTSTLHEVETHGPRGKRINIVFLSEGFTVDELASGKFENHVQSVIDYLFSREPWNRYRAYCNIYRIEIASNESGTDNVHAVPPQQKDTYLGAYHDKNIERLLLLSNSGSSRAFALLNQHVPEYDIPIVIVNDTVYGGSGGSLAVASLHFSGTLLVEHEVGHSFAQLGDEYEDFTPGYPETEYPNATAKRTREEIRWNLWIDPLTPLQTPENDPFYRDKVGHFEGANYRPLDWFRPHYSGLMRQLGAEPGSVTRESFVLTYYDKVSPIDEFTPSVTTQKITQRQTLSFSVTPKVVSEAPAISVQWRKDGGLTPIGTGPSLVIPSQNLGEGKHTITAVITDPTPWVKRDPTALLEETVTWNLTLSNQGEPPVIQEEPTAVLAEVGEAVDFHVSATAVGPDPLKYQWYKNGKAISRATQSTYSIAAAKLTDGGVYTVRVSGGSPYVEVSADLVVVDTTVQALVLAQGKVGTLTAKVTGPVQDYAWFRDDEGIPDGTSGYSGLDTGKLVISDLSVNDHRGTYSVRLVTAAGEGTYDTHRLDIFDEAPQLTLTAADSLPDGQVGAFYGGEAGVLIEIASIPGRPASAYRASGLPPGLKVDPQTGVISGRPTAYKKDKAGQVIPYLVTLQASNGKGSDKVTVALRVSPLPEGVVGSWVAPLARHGPPHESEPGLNDGLGGRLDLVTTANGAYSGKVALGRLTYSFKGLLTSTIASSVVTGSTTIKRSGKEALTLDFSLTGNTQTLSGTIQTTGESIEFKGWLNPWSKTHPADAFDGYHTFRLDLNEPPVGAPVGRGFGSFTLATDGKTKIAGRTADGETFTSASLLGVNGELMIFSVQKGKPSGSVVGHFSIHKQGDEEDANNLIMSDPDVLSWWKPPSADPKARVYKEGVGPIGLTIIGGRYQVPAPDQVVFEMDPGVSNANLLFSGASLADTSQPPDTSVDILAKNKAQASAPLPAKTSLVINAKLGTFTGKFNLLDDNPRGDQSPASVPRAVTYQGIIVKDGGLLRGDGYFLLPDLPSPEKADTPKTSPIQSGSVQLIPEP